MFALSSRVAESSFWWKPLYKAIMTPLPPLPALSWSFRQGHASKAAHERSNGPRRDGADPPLLCQLRGKAVPVALDGLPGEGTRNAWVTRLCISRTRNVLRSGAAPFYIYCRMLMLLPPVLGVHDGPTWSCSSCSVVFPDGAVLRLQSMCLFRLGNINLFCVLLRDDAGEDYGCVSSRCLPCDSPRTPHFWGRCSGAQTYLPSQLLLSSLSSSSPILLLAIIFVIITIIIVISSSSSSMMVSRFLTLKHPSVNVQCWVATTGAAFREVRHRGQLGKDALRPEGRGAPAPPQGAAPVAPRRPHPEPHRHLRAAEAGPRDGGGHSQSPQL